MTSINLNEAKTHLSRYARRVKRGETIILCDRNRPFAEILPLGHSLPRRNRELGQFKGQCPVSSAFFEAGASIAADFEGGPPLHRDPFDRMLISHALCEGLKLATPDPLIHPYPVATFW